MPGKIATPSLEGWGNLLAQTTLDRPEKKTLGTGNDLPEAPLYVIQTPNRQYTGIGAGRLSYQLGMAQTEDRELAWALKTDFGYGVEPRL